MKINSRLDHGTVRIALSGRLDSSNAMEAEQYFLKYAQEHNDFVLDFAEVEYVTSAGIRALLTLYRTLSDKEGSMSIRNASAPVRHVLEETNFAELFDLQ